MDMFSGQDGEYGLESEEVILTPEDENPLRRILQVHIAVSPWISLPSALYLFLHMHKHPQTHSDMHTY